MNIAVIGSRSITNKILVDSVLDKLSIKSITSGGAIGPDILSKEYAVNKKIPYKEYLPDWEKYGRSAGYIRNIDIVKDVDLVIAFWDKESKDTLNNINNCLDNYKNIITIDIDGNKIPMYTKIFRIKKYNYKRRVNRGESYFECSTKGHKEYSPFYAKLKLYNKTIEEIYQCEIKGFLGADITDVKGHATNRTYNTDMGYKYYYNLWVRYFKENIDLYKRLLKLDVTITITDMFSTTSINQARAICGIMNNGLFYKDVKKGSYATMTLYTENTPVDHEAVYLFGDNLIGKGKAGQAVIRDNSQAVGIPTKRLPCMSDDCFFSDKEDEIKAVRDKMNYVNLLIDIGYTVYIPSNGIGTGLARLESHSPKIKKMIDKLTTHIE